MSQVAIFCADPALLDEALDLSSELDFPIVETATCEGYLALLDLSSQGLVLRPQGAHASGPVSVDFGAGNMRHRRRGGHNEPLGRAVGVGKRECLHIADATAGLGRDSFVLADLGCRVSMLERSATAFALLRNGLSRAQASEDSWLREVSARMTLQRADGRDFLAAMHDRPDVVYLDPMFPERKKSARVKKEMWLFHHLIGPDPQESQLLEAALASASWRVVVKRPVKAPPLEGPVPHHDIPGKTIRFDVYNSQVASGAAP